MIMEIKTSPEFGARIKDSLDEFLNYYDDKYRFVDYNFLNGDYVNYGIYFTVIANFNVTIPSFNVKETTFDIQGRTIKISGGCFHDNWDNAKTGLNRILNSAR